MATKNQEIQNLLEKGNFEEFEEIEPGSVKTTLELGTSEDQIIVQLTQPGQSFRLNTTNYITQKLEPTEIPIPEIIHDGRENNPGFLVHEKIKGKQMYETEINSEIARQAGKYLAKIHQIELPGSGAINCEKENFSTFNPYGDSWQEYFEKRSKEALRKSLVDQRMPDQKIAEAIELLDSTQETLSNPEADRLIHNDYRPGNILVKNEEIVAILDWDNAILGDSVYGFARAEDRFAQYGFEEELRQGYENEKGLVEEDNSFWLYKLGSAISGLEAVNYHIEKGDGFQRWHEDHFERFYNHLEAANKQLN